MVDLSSGRPDLVEAARRWLGTPYRHQASLRGVGADCLGLVRGVWRDVIGPEPEEVPAYSQDWAEARGDEQLLSAAQRLLEPADADDIRSGDALLFRMIERGPAKHIALVSEVLQQPHGCDVRMIHAYTGHDVCETALTVPWRRRLAGVFRFPV